MTTIEQLQQMLTLMKAQTEQTQAMLAQQKQAATEQAAVNKALVERLAAVEQNVPGPSTTSTSGLGMPSKTQSSNSCTHPMKI